MSAKDSPAGKSRSVNIILHPPRTGMSVRYTPTEIKGMTKRVFMPIAKVRAQAGFTSVEMMLVSMLILSVMALVIKQAAVLNEDSKANTAMSNVRGISNVIQARLGNRENFSEVSNTVVHSFLPQGILLFDGTAFVSPFNSALNVRPTAIEGEVNSGFEIDILDVPTRACTTMVLGLSREFDEIVIGRAVVKTGGAEVMPPVQDVIRACARSGSSNRIMFRGAG